MKRRTIEELRSVLEIDQSFLRTCCDHLRYLGERGGEYLEEDEETKDLDCMKRIGSLFSRFEHVEERTFRYLVRALPGIASAIRDLEDLMQLGIVATSDSTLGILGDLGLARFLLASGGWHHSAITETRAKIRRLERKQK